MEVNRPETWELYVELGPLMVNIMSEGDRAAALIGAAYVDECLREAFRKMLLRGTTTTALLGPAGPLGSYEARVKLAYSMGFLSKTHRADLDTVGRIRNRFAHTFRACTFQDNDIVELCRKLKYPDHMRYDALIDKGVAAPGRICYSAAVSDLGCHLQTCIVVTTQAEIANPFQVNAEGWKGVREQLRLTKHGL